MESPVSPFVLILIGSHFALGPRAQKEAAAAKAAGFRVMVRGVWWDDALATEDLQLAAGIGVEFAPIMDLRQRGWTTRMFRIKQRLAREMYERLGIVTSRSFGMAAPEMLVEAIRLDPDVTMVHSEAGLWVGDQLLKREFKVGVDFEDWFSEDLPVADRKGRPVAAIKQLERRLLLSANLTIATTQVMAEAMAMDAHSNRIPLSIANCFPWAQAPKPEHGARDERDSNAVSFYWFSQTIGPGRGLETLAQALHFLQGDWELHLRGELRGYRSWFESTFRETIRDRVKLHALVPNMELAGRSFSHDVGLALEIPYCLNKDYTASNKIFEYLRCSLAVIATSTKGQKEVMKLCPNAGWIVPPEDVSALAAVMQLCLDNPISLIRAREAAAAAASGVWAWEAQEPILQASLLAVLNRPIKRTE